MTSRRRPRRLLGAGAVLVLIAGGAAGKIAAGRHVKYDTGTPLANLHLSILDMFGVPTVDRIGDSTGRLEHLSGL